MRETAKRLGGVYIGLTVVLAVAYMAAGMSLFDGVNHSFTTVPLVVSRLTSPPSDTTTRPPSNGSMSDEVAGRVVAFMMLSIVILAGGAMLIAASGNDMITSLSASATSLGNVGPGMGQLDHGGDFRALHSFGRVIAIIQMLLGRLEIYPVILALSVVTLRLPNAARRLRQRA